MTNRDDCLAALVAPPIARGTIVANGNYYRNLKKKHLAKRIVKDDDGNPAAGRRLTQKFWNDAEAQDGFSVNCSKCMSDPRCSILMQTTKHEFEHVLLLDLERVTDRLGHPIGAQYDPDGENVCHYNLVPLEGSLGVIMLLKDLIEELEDLVPQQLPKDDDAREQLRGILREFEFMFTIIRFPLAEQK